MRGISSLVLRIRTIESGPRFFRRLYGSARSDCAPAECGEMETVGWREGEGDRWRGVEDLRFLAETDERIVISTREGAIGVISFEWGGGCASVVFSRSLCSMSSIPIPSSPPKV